MWHQFMLFLTFILYLFDNATATQTTVCPEGTHLYYSGDTHVCLTCPQGTFMSWKEHTANKCFDCAKIENLTVEIVIKPCNKIYDTDIQCVDGYYRPLARNPQSCNKCSSTCPQDYFQVHPCKNFTDIGCCSGENLDETGLRKCRVRPSMCGRGQYLNIRLNDCKPCPENTFMSEDYHVHPKCWDCQRISDSDLPLHAVVNEPCTSTRPPQYGCEDGFYIYNGSSYKGDDISCSPCQTCDEGMYIGQQCDMYHDTVCCDKPNMAVTYTLQGGTCIDVIGKPHLYPYVRTLRVRQGGCQSVMCYVALEREKKKPDLTWDGPNVDKQQQFQFEEQNDLTGITVYHNTLTVCNFSAADEGEYKCINNFWTLRTETHLSIVFACKDGSYNPPACDKSCSQHCRVSERSDVSLCDHNNGTCLFGCLEGYTGDRCETVLHNSCPFGTYGRNCTKCSPRCLTPTDPLISPCDWIDGTCVGGCRYGYTGPRCSPPEMPVSSTSKTSYPQQTTETRPTTVTTSSVPETTIPVTRPSVPTTTPVTRSTVSQASPHVYIIFGFIILGISVLFAVAAIVFCVYKRRKILWKCFCIRIRNKTSRNSSRRYVNVQTELGPASQPATEDDDDEEHPYEILHIYESVH